MLSSAGKTEILHKICIAVNHFSLAAAALTLLKGLAGWFAAAI